MRKEKWFTRNFGVLQKHNEHKKKSKGFHVILGFPKNIVKKK